VSSSDCDLRELPGTRAIFERLRPKCVLHLAARVGGVKSNAEHNADLLVDNMQINANVLSVSQQCGVSRLISILSSCAFDLHSDRRSNEENLHSGLPFEGNLGYGCAKRMLDLHTRLLWKQYKVRFSTIAPVTMYGPRDNFDLDGGHVIGALIHKAVRAKMAGGALEVWGSGRAIRQFAYVEDVARLLLAALKTFDGPETVIVAPDSGITIQDLVKAVTEAVGFDGPVHFNIDKPEGVLVKRIESGRFAGCFPGFQFTPLREGLAKTVEWFVREEGRKPSKPISARISGVAM